LQVKVSPRRTKRLTRRGRGCARKPGGLTADNNKQADPAPPPARQAAAAAGTSEAASARPAWRRAANNGKGAADERDGR